MVYFSVYDEFVAYSLDNAHAVGSRPVYYGVNDVAFDPAWCVSYTFVSQSKSN